MRNESAPSIESALSILYRNHLNHAISADEVDLARCSNGHFATGANILSGAGLFRCCGRGRRSVRRTASRCACDATVLAAHADVCPPLGDDEVNQGLCGGGDRPADARVIVDAEVARLGGCFEFPVVVSSAAAAILHAVLQIYQMHHLVQ